MTVGILATGDELVHGDTLNTNGRDIAHTLSSEALPLGFHVSCSDKEDDIINCLDFLTQKHDIIIITGGLGPTTDDLTRFALSRFTGQALVEHPLALEHIKQRLSNAKLVLNQGNIQQCLFPKQAQLLPNPFGSALGCFYPWNDKKFFLLPGPPRECLPMFHHYVLPILQQTAHSQKQILKWRIFGLAESEIAQKLEDALQDVDCQTGYRWESPYIEFKVRCIPTLVDKVKAIVDPLLQPHIISGVDKKASENLRELISRIGVPITIIDEATGGLLQLLLSKPDVYSLLDFSGLHPHKLFFHIRGLKEYWQQQPTGGTTQIMIKYRNHDQDGGETHNLPYRTAAVIEHAAEWLCFRLFHLINQLH
ncbi:competence/damage-inducible protein A [Fluoribacter dumoffii]|uniref:CinA-like protein n=1 Tax=Fluoribacter dumoffii TaxID=463 RepID=A0A377GCG2_9GAMM|nr:competence/damage-inducible protein A [Fluoribacter dumoffii]KTC90900.1 competence damage inducible protein CinA [Fluoribacter dumoffii NY 23]MCW8386470.1 competence/damage-inducible protein A [Fluoribacter dumoffii]MCW8419523.1 competence/damage-inducible protein A [Fluoribacter dumoffii]MCW8455774.1 competence/damage-inducible protein A [Fluoribacter dumoffii]MCW8460147.1 competence/damage-inducible protein A [Fluoribacter dumoffii]